MGGASARFLRQPRRVARLMVQNGKAATTVRHVAFRSFFFCGSILVMSGVAAPLSLVLFVRSVVSWVLVIVFCAGRSLAAFVIMHKRNATSWARAHSWCARTRAAFESARDSAVGKSRTADTMAGMRACENYGISRRADRGHKQGGRH